MVLEFTAPDETDAAVVMCTDEAFLPYTLHLIRQIAFRCPGRDFDLVLVSETPLDLPDYIRAFGVRHLVCHAVEDAPQLRSKWVPRVYYLRLFLPRLLGDRYRRLLYLDSDIYAEGGDLGRLLRLDLGPHPLAAVTDIDGLLNPNFHAPEFKGLKLGPLRYFNAGVLLIDTPAWEDAEILERCLQFPIKHPEAFVKHDQSILNGVLRGRFAELSPVWNWMCNTRMHDLTHRFAPRFRHFCGSLKPWNDPKAQYDARFRLSYAEFFRVAGLQQDARQPGPVDIAPWVMPWKKLFWHALDRLHVAPQVEAALSRFRDEWDVKL